MTLDNYKH